MAEEFVFKIVDDSSTTAGQPATPGHAPPPTSPLQPPPVGNVPPMRPDPAGLHDVLNLRAVVDAAAAFDDLQKATKRLTQAEEERLKAEMAATTTPPPVDAGTSTPKADGGDAGKPISEADLAEIRKRYGAEAAEMAVKNFGVRDTPKGRPAAPTPDIFDPAAEARALAELGKQKQAIETARQDLLKQAGKTPSFDAGKPGHPQAESKTFDAVAEAQKLVEAEERRRQVEEARLAILKERGKLQADKFDAAEEARRILGLEEKRLAVQRELNKLRAAEANLKGPGDAVPTADHFDPKAEAARLREAELRRMKVRAAYANLTEGPGTALDPTPPAAPKPDIFGQLGNLAQGIGFPRAGAFIQNLGAATAKPPVPPGGGGAGAAEAAGAAGGEAAGGLAAAAGAAVPIIGAVAIAANQMAKVFSGVSQDIEGFGQKTAMLAQNQNWGAMLKHVDDTAEHFRALPIVGDMLAEAAKLPIAPLKAFTTAVEGFVSRAHELEGFSGDITQATAMADVRSLLADLKEAQDLGPELGRLVDAQSRADNELREILLPMKNIIVGELANGMERVTHFLEEHGETLKKIAEDAAKAATETASFGLGFVAPGFASMARLLGLIHSDMPKKKDEEQPYKWMDDLAEQSRLFLNNQRVPGRHPGRGNRDPMNIPAFQRIIR